MMIAVRTASLSIMAVLAACWRDESRTVHTPQPRAVVQSTSPLRLQRPTRVSRRVPDPPPQLIPPATLLARRIAGAQSIDPSEMTKRQIALGKQSVVSTFKLCADESGEVVDVEQLKSSGYPDYDRDLEELIWTWRFRPYDVNGKAVPVCTLITLMYPPRP